ncbi:hypothetical protein C4N9_21605 [Pararhodobacter marinus]|uniref:Uncharacterized protein n=1 Tax=Pararhodobacter marinus TaxID=2184063 RepID=A0A2U2C3R1_9RHOB|nr:hypothetical protein [Pararhodobacter marinus]PWE26520.1 hypothetical protein C4N9_21605 [Pararhodobacter marinus]
MTTVYQTGAISVGSGSTSVTGSGTAWTTSGTRPGDLLIAGGAVALIASVNSATSITLANSWPIETQSSVSYFILQLDDGLRALAASNLLLQALNGGALTSLAGLSGGADKLAFYNGNNTFGLTDFGAAARTFLAAGPVVTANALDATAGRLLKVGDFGLGIVGAPNQLADLNSFDSVEGMYAAGSGTLNRASSPWGNSYHIVQIHRYGATSLLQVVRKDMGAYVETYVREGDSSTGWGPWRLQYGAANILGGVSQSGGVPTGAIIERGSNGNGVYVRFADGTQICWRTVSVNLGSTDDQTFAMPAVFATDTVFTSMNPVNNTMGGDAFASNARARISGSATWSVRNRTSTGHTGSETFVLFATGRWI